MSRKVREIKKTFKIFCEGDTEYHYMEGMRRAFRLSISLKMVNMEGGGYSSFLDDLRKDGNANCLAKFIIIDGDRAVKEYGERENLRKLLEYCKIQNASGRTPHILIINYPDFEYIGCLHTPKYKGQNVEQYIIKEMGYKDIGAFKSDKCIYKTLNTKGNSCDIMQEALRKRDCFVRNTFRIHTNRFEIKVSTGYDWEKLECRGSNLDELFFLLRAFS